MMKKLLSILAVILLGAGPLYAAKVTDITLSHQPGVTVAKIIVTGQVRLTHLTEVPKNGRGHRVIVDVLAATHELGQKNFTELPKCMVSSIRTSQFAVVPEQVVRFVFDVNQAPLYRIESDKSSVTIYFTDKGASKFANWNSKTVSVKKQKPVAPKLAKTKSTAPKVAVVKPIEPKLAKPRVVAVKPIEPKLATPKVVASKAKTTTPKVAVKPIEPKLATPKVVASKAKTTTPKVVASKPKATTTKIVTSKPPIAGGADISANNELDMFAMGKRTNPTTKWTSTPQPPAKQTTTVARKVQPKAKPVVAKAPVVVKPAKSATPKVVAKANTVKAKPATKPVTLAQTSVAKPVVSKAVAKKPAASKPKVTKPKSSQRKPVVVAKTKTAPKTMPLKSEMKPSGDKTAKVKAKKSGQSALANKIAKPKSKTKVASAPKAKKEKPAKSSTSRFRRTSGQVKFKGTMVVEFPKRLVIKYKGKRYRDPFETLINASRTNNNPIEKRVPNIDGLRLVGVIESDSKSDRALFEDTDGFGFILKSGDKVRNGYVLRVEADRVYFQIFEYGWSRTVALQLDN